MTCSLGFILSPKLHTDSEILKTRDLFTLKSWFGRQHGSTDGWGDGETTNWTEHWQFFGLGPDGTLRAQTIFAHAAQSIGKRDKPFGEITPTKSMPPFVRIMNLRTCELRPVTPSK